MMYELDAVKQDPDTKTLAQCIDSEGDQQWLVLGYNKHVVPLRDVESWTDLTP